MGGPPAFLAQTLGRDRANRSSPRQSQRDGSAPPRLAPGYDRNLAAKVESGDAIMLPCRDSLMSLLLDGTPACDAVNATASVALPRQRAHPTPRLRRNRRTTWSRSPVPAQ